ncbi:MAG: hypothetical protein SV062_05240, partial [Thermodesulfobacteriota bacterium]|nr:hypothetical protein [Thermodesulfobacteriota bacterium]
IISIILFSTYSVVNAEEYQIKPGVVITKGNLDKYLPELKNLLPEGAVPWISNALRNGWITMPIVNKVQYPLCKGFLEASLNNKGKFKVGKDNKLIGLWNGK